MQEAKERTLRDLIRAYPRGLNNKGWHGSILSGNPTLTDQVVEENPQINWDRDKLLKNGNLSSNFRLQLVKRTPNPAVYLRTSLTFLDLPIFQYLLEEFEKEGISQAIRIGWITDEAFEWFYHSKYSQKFCWDSNIQRCPEVIRWMVINSPVLSDNLIMYFLGTRPESEPADEIIKRLDGFSISSVPLICFSSDPIKRLRELVGNPLPELPLNGLLGYSQSLEFTRTFMELCPWIKSVKDSGIHRAVIDSALAIEILRDPAVNRSWKESILKSKYIDSDVLREFLSNPNIVEEFGPVRTARLVLDSYKENSLFVEADIAAILMENLEGAVGIKALELIAEESLSKVRWKLYLPVNKLNAYVSDLETLGALHGYTHRINYISWDGEINDELLSYLHDNVQIMTKMNWTRLSEGTPPELIADYMYLRWKSDVLSHRTYEPSIRMMMTKPSKRK